MPPTPDTKTAEIAKEVPLRFRYTNAPVDVIIPFYGQYGTTCNCISNLIALTLGQPYALTLVDDASPNALFHETLEKDKLKGVPFKYHRHSQQRGFGAALQTGFNNTVNPWICFLHSDCQIVQSDWLLQMLTTIQKLKKDGVKLVSAKLDNGGSGYFDEAVIGDRSKRDDIIVESPVPLACVLVNRSLFDHIGGFIKNYHYYGYESDELFWRMKLYGFKQAVCGRAFVRHKGAATVEEITKDKKIKVEVEKNKDLFIKDIQELNLKLKEKKKSTS